MARRRVPRKTPGQEASRDSLLARPPFGLLAIAGAVALVGTAVWWWTSRPVPPQVQRTSDQNVLLITIDTLRADTLAAFGGRVASPTLDRLAHNGMVFDFAHAHAVVTLPSHASILTGLYPYQHGVRENSGFRLRPDVPTLATQLKAGGFATAAFIGAFPLDSRFGLDRGFDLYDDRYPEATGLAEFVMPERSASAVVGAVRQWIAGQRGRWFAWVHLFDPHAPYRPPSPFDRRYQSNPYDGEAAYVDAALAPLVDDIDRTGGRPTLVVVTADHGESLGEHGEATHGLFAYEATLRIPLLVAQVPQRAGRDSAPTTVSSPVFHVDVVPTVLDVVGLEPEPGLPGRSLRSMSGSHSRNASQRPGYFEAMSATLNRGWAPLSGVLVGREKYIDLPIAELYDLSADPSERDNLAPRKGDRVRVLNLRLRELGPTPPGERQQESQEVVERLRALGYVSGNAPPKTWYTEADDPKLLVALDQAIHRGVELYETRRWDEAVPVYESILEERPDMTLAWRHLAALQWQLGRPKEAIDAIRRGLSHGARSAELETQLATYLAETGRAAEAVKLLEPRRGSDDVDVLNALGIAYAQSGSYREALTAFERILSLTPGSATALQNVGSLKLERGDLEGARLALRQAIAVDAGLAGAHTALGAVEMKSGNRAAALEEWRQAVSLDASEFDALYNLAAELVRDGRLEEARPYVERFVRTAPPAFYEADIRRFEALLRPR